MASLQTQLPLLPPAVDGQCQVSLLPRCCQAWLPQPVASGLVGGHCPTPPCLQSSSCGGLHTSYRGLPPLSPPSLGLCTHPEPGTVSAGLALCQRREALGVRGSRSGRGGELGQEAALHKAVGSQAGAARPPWPRQSCLSPAVLAGSRLCDPDESPSPSELLSEGGSHWAQRVRGHSRCHPPGRWPGTSILAAFQDQL